MVRRAEGDGGGFCLRLAAAGGPGHGLPNAALLEMVAGYRQVRSSGDVSKLQVSAPEENTFVVTLSNRCAYFLKRRVYGRRPPCRYAASSRRTGRRIPRSCVPTGPTASANGRTVC